MNTNTSTASRTPENVMGLFFNFVKFTAILGVFSFHAYNDCFSEGAAFIALQNGLLKHFLAGAKSPLEYVFVIFQTFFSFGSIGVELFIIASGFGLYYSFITKKNASWLFFFKKRLVRIMPLYYLTLIGAFLCNILIFKAMAFYSLNGFKSLGQHVVLLQTMDNTYLDYGFLFYVAVIFQLYLIFPLLAKSMKSRAWGVAVFFISLFISPLISGFFKLMNIHFTGILFTDFLPFFLLGMLIAESAHNNGMLHKLLFDSRVSSFSFLCLIAAIYLVSYHFDYGTSTRRLIVFLIFFSLPLFFNLPRHPVIHSAIRRVAYSTYSIYLSHMFILKLGKYFFLREGIGNIFYRYNISFGVAFLIISIVSSYFIQKVYDKKFQPLFFAK